MLKVLFVRPIAEWLVGGFSATAQGNDCPSLKAVCIAFFVYDFKIPVNFQRAIIVYCDFGHGCFFDANVET